CRHGYGSPYSF
nr:immunoglobulin light chain junction region [Macaca mulatta]